MNRQRRHLSSQRGFALAYMAVVLTCLLLFTGLAVDSGRAYVVKAQLTKAVDGAALGAARNLNSGDPRAEAERIFKANFPSGYMNTTWATDPASDPGFFSMTTDDTTGRTTVAVSAAAIMPTTFMRLGNFTQVNVNATGEAMRRMVDLSLVIDVSGSIGWRWPYVRDGARAFVNAFDQNHDRLSLITYSSGAGVIDAMPSARGFNKTQLMADIPNSLPGGVTSMPEGLYRGWDELRTVPAGQQSTLRIIVLFTDGSGNVIPGVHDGTGIAKGLFTSDFPKRLPDPDNITTNNPTLQGLYQTETGNRNPSVSQSSGGWSSNTTIASIPYLPVGTVSSHQHHRSAGIPVLFPLQTNTLMVNGVPQSTRRQLLNWNAGVSRYAAHTRNIRNAVTNLTEIVANAARDDVSGDYRVRIYTLGMGELVQYLLGAVPETSESVLMRVANDRDSADYQSGQLEGKYFFAETPDDVGAAFQGIQNEILRLTK